MDNRTQPLPGGVWRIESAPSTNAYLVARDGVGDAEGLALVDTGTRASGPRLVRSIRALGLDPTRLREVLLTHWHADHAGSAARLAASSAKPRILAGTEDGAVLSGRAAPTAGRPTRAGRLLQRRLRAPAPAGARALVAGTEPVPGLRVIPAPGHTEGHLAFWFPATGLLLAGDAVQHVLWLSARPKAAHADVEAATTTLQRLADLEPEVVACGHGPPLRRRTASRLSTVADRAGKHLAP